MNEKQEKAVIGLSHDLLNEHMALLAKKVDGLEGKYSTPELSTAIMGFLNLFSTQILANVSSNCNGGEPKKATMTELWDRLYHSVSGMIREVKFKQMEIH